MQGYNPLMTPTPGMPHMAGPYWQKDLYDRNKPLTDEELDALIPASGYEVSIFI
jgi:predicted carbohydrate-binding protein with CBM5 and CBM33 domain